MPIDICVVALYPPLILRKIRALPVANALRKHSAAATRESPSVLPLPTPEV